jgi:hypothetical protein
MCFRPASKIALLLVAGALSALIPNLSEGREEILSFDMWCLEMQSYAAQRCESRRADDLKDYDRYRVSVERYQERRASQDKRDKAMQEKLNRDPINPNRDLTGGPAR